MKQVNNIEIEYNCTCPGRSDELTETTIYRAVCELINNSVKHSGGDKITINITKDKKEQIVHYQDNGQGFSLDSIFNTNKGMGLNNLQNRIRNINGDINFKTAKGEGFETIIKIKL